MVKMVKLFLMLGLVFAFTSPVFAQDDYPVFQIAPGYGNYGNENLTGNSGRHSGFTLDTDFNLNSKLGIELFTGYYSLGSNTTAYTNTFGGIYSLRKNSHVIPFGVAGFGFGIIQLQTPFGTAQGRSMAYRLGGGVDIPFHDSLAIRVSATSLGFHFNHAWESGANYSVGVVLNLSQ